MTSERDSIIFGFDSAWGGRARGAVCALTFDPAGAPDFVAPELASFDEALAFIHARRGGYRFSLLALDQPTIVPNAGGARPVDRVAASLVSRAGGGVQPANRGKAALFGGDAPIWRFLGALGAVEDPLEARGARAGHFLIEVFPALALLSLSPGFAGPRAAPKYNPANRRRFRPGDWRRVAAVVAEMAGRYGVPDVARWASAMAALPAPTKADQDWLDAAICALVGLIWRAGPPEAAAMIGDTDVGYMVTPVTPETRARLAAAAEKRGVAIR